MCRVLTQPVEDSGKASIMSRLGPGPGVAPSQRGDISRRSLGVDLWRCEIGNPFSVPPVERHLRQAAGIGGALSRRGIHSRLPQRLRCRAGKVSAQIAGPKWEAQVKAPNLDLWAGGVVAARKPPRPAPGAVDTPPLAEARVADHMRKARVQHGARLSPRSRIPTPIAGPMSRWIQRTVPEDACPR